MVGFISQVKSDDADTFKTALSEMQTTFDLKISAAEAQIRDSKAEIKTLREESKTKIEAL